MKGLQKSIEAPLEALYGILLATPSHDLFQVETLNKLWRRMPVTFLIGIGLVMKFVFTEDPSNIPRGQIEIQV